MVNVADFYRPDPEAFERGYARVNNLRQDRARMTAGKTLAAGDYQGAAGELMRAGLADEGLKVARFSEVRAAEADKAKAEKDKAKWEYVGDMASRLLSLNKDRDDPQRTVEAFDAYFVPRLRAMGETDDEIAKTRAQLGSSPRQTLMMLGAASAKQRNLQIIGDGMGGYRAVDPADGKTVHQEQGRQKPEWREITDASGNTSFVDLNSWEDGETGPPAVSSPRSAPGGGERAAPAPAGGNDAGAYMDPLIAQESGGNGKAVGPQTPYGRALGSTQMLPETAEGMARKLGVEWRPELMRENTPEAMDYQRRLGQAYLQEGLDKYGGDLRKALMYYHGGPDESLWGPKTNAYADNVIRRMEGAQPYKVAAVGDTPPPPAGGGRYRRVVPGSAPKKEKPGYRMMTDAEKAERGLAPDSQFQIGPEGQVSRIADGRSERPPTEGQVNNASLTYAILGGNERMNGLAERGIYKPTSPLEDLVKPGENGLVTFIGRNETDRQFLQAALEFLAPLLRKDTGAAVTYQELITYGQTYIPTYMDGPGTLWAKAQARDTAIRRLYGSGRKAYDAEYGDPGKWRVLTDPRGAPNAPKGAPPAAAIEKLKKNPNLRAAFDAKYGAGASAKALAK